MPAIPLAELHTATAVGIFAWMSSQVKLHFPFICSSCTHLQHISTRLCLYQLTAFSSPARVIKQTHVCWCGEFFWHVGFHLCLTKPMTCLRPQEALLLIWRRSSSRPVMTGEVIRHLTHSGSIGLDVINCQVSGSLLIFWLKLRKELRFSQEWKCSVCVFCI